MKAITLYEPWASLMAIGAKVNETRPARTKHRGDICIHAALKGAFKEPSPVQRPCEQAFLVRGERMQFFYGHIVAVVELWDVRPAEFFRGHLESDAFRNYLLRGGMIEISEEEFDFGNYLAGRWIYRTRNLRRLKVPVKARGLQCVGWTVPPEVERQVLEQLAKLPHAEDAEDAKN